ncbi:MAG: glycoside hydrolase 15-related [Chthoniobacteraceae bacterium]|nr:glycoside hydrolase 15-related [Chthoniobacteraceae bacterium]
MKIEDYGFIGDMETAALVGKNGSIDWLCMPRFDSPACFAALLGTEENGFWKIAPTEPARSSRQYRGNSLILETDFETGEGAVRLIDFMPPRDCLPDLVRIVEGVRGRVTMVMTLVVRFDYGQAVPWVRRRDGGIEALAGPDAVLLQSDVETHGEGLHTVARFEVEAGQRIAFVLTWYPAHQSPPRKRNAGKRLQETEKFWETWANGHVDRGDLQQDEMRSLLVLKGLTYAPTGGVLAAATTSLPEQIGGVRNWDYRFCWLRDATFTLYALLNAGYTSEAKAWCKWLLRAIAGDPAQMQTMYGVAGERRLMEFELPHLAGYEGSQPVRVGNAASSQFQLDVYGEVMDSLHQARRAGIEPGNLAWALQRHLVDFVIRHWKDPDEGIWEVRGPRRDFTHSKVMAWVALDRAVKAVEGFNLPGDLEKWRAVRDEMHREICARGFNEKRGAFTQFFGSDLLDASTLLLPLVGFLPANDPRILGTINAIEQELMVDGFVLRYQTKTDGAVDGLPAGEGAFLPCSFWLVDALYLSGRIEDAHALFERLRGVRNDLGLFAEEYDPVARRLTGNFPQAFTHVAFANSARNLRKVGGPAEERAAC